MENFRIYESRTFTIDGDIVIFTGKNGAGKSSILEAISLIGSLKSFRPAADRDLIRYGANQYFIEIGYESSGVASKLGLGYGKKSTVENRYERRMRHNAEIIERVSEFIGKVQTVIFAPDDINIIDSGPVERRRFIDILLSTIYNEYLLALQNYRRLLKVRSAFFVRSSRLPDEKYMESFDMELIQTGARIQDFRKKFVDDFQIIFDRYISRISSDSDRWKIRYYPSIENGDVQHNYRAALARSRGDDLRYRQTTKGIHRDRIMIVRDDKNSVDISKSGSQGQKRTAVLALKMGQYEYTRQKTTRKPVLLIDDVLNELDIDRRKKFIEFLQDTGQAFITATDISALSDFIEKKRETSKIQIFNL